MALIIILLSMFCTLLYADVLSEEVSNNIYEPPETYDTSEPDILNIYIKTFIENGSCTVGEYTGCTLKDVLNENYNKNFKPEVKINFDADDYFSSSLTNNATLRQRGGIKTRKAPLKSFRIKLNKGTPLWHEQRRIQLVKAFYDRSRIRNKLSFDLFSQIPHLPSLRSQFVRFTIEDNGSVLEQGLYTHIEYIGKEYLERRGWNKDSRLYKAEYFLFSNDAALKINDEGKPVNKDNFENILEIKRGKNHKAFIEMLSAIENNELDFQTEIFDTYFDKNNFLTWLAVNILVNNPDTRAHNYYLYNPKGSKKFYFLPWDYDRAWGHAQESSKELVNQLPNWWFSHANWWENKMIKRFLITPGNLTLLENAVSEIKRKYLTPKIIKTKVESYRNIVFPVIRETADWNTIDLKGNTDPERIAEYNHIMDSFSHNVEFNYKKFTQRLNDPMPFRLKNPVIDIQNNEIAFSWEESISLTGQNIIYDLEIANDKEFEEQSIVERIQDIPENVYKLQWSQPKGTYYFRVISRDANAPSIHWQIAFDRLIKRNNGLDAYGIKSFVVPTYGEGSQNKSGSLSWIILFFLLLHTIANRQHRIKLTNIYPSSK